MNAAKRGIAQVAFVVVVRNLTPVNSRLYDRQAHPKLSVAIAYTGSTMIELIEEHGEVGLPTIGACSDADCRFHHIARTTTDFATDHERLMQQGHSVVFEASLPASLGGGRFAYFDNPAPFPGYLELVELAPDLTALFGNLCASAERWGRQNAVIDAGALLGAAAV